MHRRCDQEGRPFGGRYYGQVALSPVWTNQLMTLETHQSSRQLISADRTLVRGGLVMARWPDATAWGPDAMACWPDGAVAWWPEGMRPGEGPVMAWWPEGMRPAEGPVLMAWWPDGWSSGSSQPRDVSELIQCALHYV